MREAFDIEVYHEGKPFKGWVIPSVKQKEDGEPVSFHVVLNDTFLGNLSYNGNTWVVDQQRPQGLVNAVGSYIAAHYKQ